MGEGVSDEIRRIAKKYEQGVEYLSPEAKKDIKRLLHEVEQLTRTVDYLKNANSELAQSMEDRPDTGESLVLLNQTQVSRIIGFSESWLEKKRFEGQDEGPRYTKIGRQVRYKLTDIIEWVNQFDAGHGKKG